jgi:hypothetical protein
MSGPVIRMPGSNLAGTVNLFDQHNANHHMRPSLNPERQKIIRTFSDLVVQSVGPSDDKLDQGTALIHEVLYLYREISAGQRLPALIKGNDKSIVTDFFDDFFMFLLLSDIQFMKDHRPEAASQIILPGFCERGIFHAPNGDDVDLCHAVNLALFVVPEEAGITSDSGVNQSSSGMVWGTPHFFEIVKGPNLWLEEVDNDIPGIDNHPVAVFYPFNPDVFQAKGMQTFRQFDGKGTDVAGRCSGGHNHKIGKGRLATKVDHFYFKGLVCIQSFQNKGFDFFQVFLPGIFCY